jgi:hypothetical protein
MGWRCTASGTLGTLNSGSTTGAIGANSNVLTLSSATGAAEGEAITIAGTTGGPFRIRKLSGTTAYLDIANAGSSVSGAAVAFSSGTLVPMQPLPGLNPTPTALSNGSTIPTTNECERCTASGSVTGVIMAAGTYGGQRCIVFNESANSITMAAVGTSNVADGTSCVIASLTQDTFVWDSGATTPAWYHS